MDIGVIANAWGSQKTLEPGCNTGRGDGNYVIWENKTEYLKNAATPCNITPSFSPRKYGMGETHFGVHGCRLKKRK